MSENVEKMNELVNELVEATREHDKTSQACTDLWDQYSALKSKDRRALERKELAMEALERHVFETATGRKARVTDEPVEGSDSVSGVSVEVGP